MATGVPVERKPLTFAERTYVPQVLSGLKTTWQHLVRPKQTMEYPEQRPAIGRLRQTLLQARGEIAEQERAADVDDERRPRPASRL